MINKQSFVFSMLLVGICLTLVDSTCTLHASHVTAAVTSEQGKINNYSRIKIILGTVVVATIVAGITFWVTKHYYINSIFKDALYCFDGKEALLEELNKVAGNNPDFGHVGLLEAIAKNLAHSKMTRDDLHKKIIEVVGDVLRLCEDLPNKERLYIMYNAIFALPYIVMQRAKEVVILRSNIPESVMIC